MAKYAKNIIEQAKSWIGLKESNGSFKVVIDTYNKHYPLANNYKVQYNDEWCATFVSAVAIKCGYTDIIPTECSCQRMIEKFKKMNCWIEDESVTPKEGWVIFYDWQDNGVGDNTGWSDHVGYVESVSGGKIRVIEGNYNSQVAIRVLSVNGKYIRGYGVPKYDSLPLATTKNDIKVNPTKSYIHAGVDYKLVFNPKYYSERYKDLRKAFGDNEQKLFEHFIKYGMKEQRQACAWFNVRAYKNNYKDLQKAFGNDIQKYYRHYIQYGYNENRKGY